VGWTPTLTPMRRRRLDHNGGLLGIESFPSTESGYGDLLTWPSEFGDLVKVGVDETGSWGVGLSLFLTNVRWWRWIGLTVNNDARSVSRIPLMRCPRLEPPYRVQPRFTPKSRDGRVEEMRVLLEARRLRTARGWSK
jgi:hypothetical protein